MFTGAAGLVRPRISPWTAVFFDRCFFRPAFSAKPFGWVTVAFVTACVLGSVFCQSNDVLAPTWVASWNATCSIIWRLSDFIAL